MGSLWEKWQSGAKDKGLCPGPGSGRFGDGAPSRDVKRELRTCTHSSSGLEIGRGTLATRKKAELASTISKDLIYSILQAFKISDKTQRIGSKLLTPPSFEISLLTLLPASWFQHHYPNPYHCI